MYECNHVYIYDDVHVHIIYDGSIIYVMHACIYVCTYYIKCICMVVCMYVTDVY